MARLSDEVIEQIKSEVSLVRLVESQGYAMKKEGKDYSLSCPFHEDKTPSLKITPDKNLYHCFGCGAAGSVIDWVMQTQGISFRHACEVLQNELSSVATAGITTRKTSDKKHLDNPLKDISDGQALLTKVLDYYHGCLRNSEEALDYLDSRGLKSDELITEFKLGFANRTLGYRIPTKAYKEGRDIRGQLNQLGVIRDSGHEHFNGSIVMPIIDDCGVISEVYGRKVTRGTKLRKGTPLHLYLPGPHVGVWNRQGLVNQAEIILCESLIDAMTFWVNGFKNVTCSYGTNGFTDEILAALLDEKVSKVLIAYDRDVAGNAAAAELAPKLNQVGIDVYRVELPKGMDVNEYALQVQPARKSLSLIVRKAMWLGQGKAPKRETQLSEEAAPLAADVVAQEKDLEQLAEIVEVESGQTQTPKLLDELVAAEVSEQEVTINLDGRHYRIRGLAKNTSYECLKVNLLVSREAKLHIDSFDLYSARHRVAFIKQAGYELGISEETIKDDLSKVLLKLEQLQFEQISGVLKAQPLIPVMSEEEREAALDLLKDKQLLPRLLNDFSRMGVVGEDVNKLVGYLAATSRKLARPLAIVIQSSSAAGKSSLMDAILNLMPEEERVQYSAMTGQSLFYMGETNLKHKILAIAEEEGAEQASYALKLLQSEGKITIASTGKNATTGQLETRDYSVEGPVMLFLTTTAIDIDEELMNRCLVLSVNESRKQTEAIHQAQRLAYTLTGMLATETQKSLINLHQNAQRLLRPLRVANPYAEQLTFLNDKTRTRRDHMKYLTLINTIALLHQHQRAIKQVMHERQVLEYIEVTVSDIQAANQIAHEVLGRSLDELPPQTRKLLKLIQNLVQSACDNLGIKQRDYHFSRKAIRAFTQWSDNQLKVHCKRLEEMEYLLVHSGGRGKLMEYELLYDGATKEQKHCMGLLNVNKLAPIKIDSAAVIPEYGAQKLGQTNQKLEVSLNKLPPSCPQDGVKLEGGATSAEYVQPELEPLCPENQLDPLLEEKTHQSVIAESV